MRDLSNTDVKNHLLWLDSNKDFLVTDEYIIILSCPPETKATQKVTQIAETIATFGAGSIGGGLLISLPAILIGGAYEKLFGVNKNQFNEEALAAIFNSGYAIYSKKSKLKFQSFTIKAGMFDVAYPVVTIIGGFENVFLGTVDLCFLYSSSHVFFKVDKTLRDAGCLVNTHPEILKEERQIDSYLSPEFPDTFLALEALRIICLKCTHYRELKGWVKVSLLSKMSGDYELATKPSNEKLPCRIPVEAASSWDQFFSVPRSDRAYIYPTNCPKFVRK